MLAFHRSAALPVRLARAWARSGGMCASSPASFAALALASGKLYCHSSTGAACTGPSWDGVSLCALQMLTYQAGSRAQGRAVSRSNFRPFISARTSCQSTLSPTDQPAVSMPASRASNCRSPAARASLAAGV